MLQPTASLTLGNLRYDTHAVAVRVILGLLPSINRADITLPAPIDIDATPGDVAHLVLDSGEQSETVVTGQLYQLSRSFRQIAVRITDAGQLLAHSRPGVTFEQQSSTKIIRSLAGDVGVDLGSMDSDLPLAAYVADQTRTAAEHIARLAQLADGLATVDGDGQLTIIKRPNGQADIALLYGREFVQYEVAERPSPAGQIVMAGNGPAGDPSAPNALRHSSKLLPENAPAPDHETRWQPTPILRSPDAALTAAQAVNTARAAASTTLTAHCFLLPHIRPGTVVQVQELPDHTPEGPWLVTQVTHRLSPRRGGQTTLVAELADTSSFGLGDLLGAALSAVGGLL